MCAPVATAGRTREEAGADGRLPHLAAFGQSLLPRTLVRVILSFTCPVHTAYNVQYTHRLETLKSTQYTAVVAITH